MRWLLASLALPIALSAAAIAAELSEERQSELAYLVRQDCGSCHGMTLKGGLGSALTMDRLADEDTAALAAIILDGVPGKPMPPWRGLLKEDEAWWIAEALKKGQIK